jgi:hypothetical protein
VAKELAEHEQGNMGKMIPDRPFVLGSDRAPL